ncbi:MAG: mannose-1-phosphate guanylyltransferase/mannose-6-phosphate isomerase [Sphingobium sp.]|nr:MAG: mannose-1-phosphate guanylyltransferase/mannose-6-phosphate isomerase [Sphingobium sp.]
MLTTTSPVWTDNILPVILSGGSGTRLWPVSRAERPKQLLSLTADETMLQLTALRTNGIGNTGRPIVVANAAHADLIDEQLAAIGFPESLILLEPFGRNTAPAIALAALAAEDPTAALLVMPSDHVILDLPAFHAAIAKAMPLVAEGWLVTFGITPDSPETGYGYIRMGDELADGVRKVANFVEKPDLERATAMLAEGGYTWNAGIFLFRADAFLKALGELQPEMLTHAGAAVRDARRDGARMYPDADAFGACPSDSIDYAIMERADKVACVPVSMGWSDVGSWDSLHQISARDDADNAVRGEVIALNASRCLVHSDGPRITLVDVDDLIVVASGDDILILPRGKAQEVRRVIEALKNR